MVTMTADRKTQLLDAIRDTDDDQPRLVYADWLEEQGELPRAMLIRLQCRIAALPAWDRAAVEARWEVDHLLSRHAGRWRAELPTLDGVTWMTFERGFVSSIQIDSADALHGQVEAIAAAAPITRVEAGPFDEQMAVPAGGVPWLRTLCLHRGELEPNDERSLLSEARELEATIVSEYEQLEWLAQRSPGVPLERVQIRGEHVAGASVARQLVELPDAAHLVALELGTQFVDHDTGYFDDPTLRVTGAELLAGAKLERVERLDVGLQRVTSKGLTALARSMPKLRELGARGCELDELSWLGADGTPIAHLDLGVNAFGARGLQAIAGSPRTRTLESLVLDTCEVSAEGITALVQSPCWSTLQHLDLSRNPIGLAGVLALVEAPPPARLHTLMLSDIDLEADAARILAQIPWLRQLRVLDVSSNVVDTTLVEAIDAGSAVWVSLAKTGIAGDVSLGRLWQRAIALDLSRVAAPTFPASGAPELQVLELRGCSLDISQLVAGSYPRLRRLVLARNPLGNSGFHELVESSLLEELDTLDISHCGLGDEIIPALAGVAFAHLELLDLRGNTFTEAGRLALARAPRLRAVRKIRLSGEHWSSSNEVSTELAERFGSDWWYTPRDERDEDA